MADDGALADLAEVPSVLVLGPSVEAAVDVGCKRLLGGDDRPVLAVTFTHSPHEWVARWEERAGSLPPEVVVVTTSDSFSGPSADEDLPERVTVEYLSSPGDLTGLGMAISKYIEQWHDADRKTALCFDSLTTLLQYDEVHNVYRFLHLITTRLSGAGAHAHFHLDPATQDRKAISTLSSTFQAVAEYDADAAEWDVSTR